MRYFLQAIKYPEQRNKQTDIIMRLSQQLHSISGHCQTTSSKIEISYLPPSSSLILDTIPSKISHKIVCLKLSYCQMDSLCGIEQFPNLQQLNIKNNLIIEVDELYRITNKEALQKLNITGNDIEHYTQAMYINLRKHFPNLYQLNGKNYHFLKHNKKNTLIPMDQMIRKIAKVDESFLKTIKINQKKQHFYNQTGKSSQQIKVKPTGHTLEDEVQESQQQQDEDQEYYQEDSSETDQSSSKIKKSQASIDQQSQTRRHHDKQNHAFNRSPLRNLHQHNISLGAISNIPMTLSIKASPNRPKEAAKKRELRIVTHEESLHNHTPLTQPTATFGNQRQLQEKEKQNQNGFVFKEKKSIYQRTSDPIEQFMDASYSECNYSKKSYSVSAVNFRGLQSEEESIDEEENSLLKNSKLVNHKQQEGIAMAVYRINLSKKAVMSLRKNLEVDEDRPMKKSNQFEV